jgi:hypothetical protein
MAAFSLQIHGDGWYETNMTVTGWSIVILFTIYLVCRSSTERLIHNIIGLQYTALPLDLVLALQTLAAAHLLPSNTGQGIVLDGVERAQDSAVVAPLAVRTI